MKHKIIADKYQADVNEFSSKPKCQIFQLSKQAIDELTKQAMGVIAIKNTAATH